MSNTATSTREIGFVTNAKSYLITLDGLPSIRVHDILINDDGHRALVVLLESDSIIALLLDNVLPKTGDRYFKCEEGLQYSLGDHLFGRVISPLGVGIDGKDSLPKGTTPLLFDVAASGIDSREEITEQFETGVLLVDSLFPLGKGQKQLLFGPTSSGKTTFMQDVIVNQMGRDVICVYVAIGKPISFIERFARSLFTVGADKYTIIIAGLAEDATPVISLTPTIGYLVAEHFKMQGKTVLLVLDDLGTHAKYLRETALLMGRIPGRQAYPGDIFYQHAHLLERSGNFNKKGGGGSITALPALETDEENFTDLIPTNLMATTDGHLFFSPALRSEGAYPAIAFDRSVTRVGRQTQNMLQKELATRIIALLVDFNKQKEYIRFGTSVSTKTQEIIKQGEIAHELLRQDPVQNIELHIQSALLGLIFVPFLLNRDISFLRTFKILITDTLRDHPKLEDVRESAKKAKSLSEFLEILNRSSHVLEKECQQ